MSLARSRRITVDGADYQWTTSREHEPGYSTRREGALFIQEAGGAGQKLRVWVDLGPVGAPKPTPITPALVAAAIRTALDLGWRPLTPGMDARMRYTQGRFSWVEDGA